MIDKRVTSVAEAVDDVGDGAVVLVSGFGEAGNPTELLHALIDHGANELTVVNNNAAATFLLLSALASGREVIESRGELVEIGGGFRVPEIMSASGAVLREVGTTNKTRVADYAAAITE